MVNKKFFMSAVILLMTALVLAGCATASMKFSGSYESIGDSSEEDYRELITLKEGEEPKIIYSPEETIPGSLLSSMFENRIIGELASEYYVPVGYTLFSYTDSGSWANTPAGEPYITAKSLTDGMKEQCRKNGATLVVYSNISMGSILEQELVPLTELFTLIIILTIIKVSQQCILLKLHGEINSGGCGALLPVKNVKVTKETREC
jgi:hypothetical protein